MKVHHLGLVLGLVAAPLESAVAAEFPYGAGTFVPPAQGDREGAVHAIGQGEAGPRPLVVFLHGLNEGGPLHKDLDRVAAVATRLVAEGKLEPLLVAGPSQTKDATRPWDMWEGFDLEAFVDAASAVMPVDRESVVLVGHSGGGCNLRGSILASKGRNASAVVAIDTCFDPKVAEALLDAPPWTRIWAYHQTSSWDRDPDGFARVLFDPKRRGGPLDRRFEKAPIEGPSAHDAILPWALRRALPALLPPRRAAVTSS